MHIKSQNQSANMHLEKREKKKDNTENQQNKRLEPSSDKLGEVKLFSDSESTKAREEYEFFEFNTTISVTPSNTTCHEKTIVFPL